MQLSLCQQIFRLLLSVEQFLPKSSNFLPDHGQHGPEPQKFRPGPQVAIPSRDSMELIRVHIHVCHLPQGAQAGADVAPRLAVPEIFYVPANRRGCACGPLVRRMKEVRPVSFSNF